MSFIGQRTDPRFSGSMMPGIGIDLNSIISSVSSAASAGGSTQSALLAPAADMVVGLPAYRTNRERVAVMADVGYGLMDKYQAAKPSLFVIGIIGMLASGFALYKRKKVPEAVTLYTSSLIASGALTWFTRPVSSASVEKTPPPASNPNSPTAMKRGLEWMDKKAAANTASSPGWESRTLTRLWSDFGGGSGDPAVNVLLTKGGH